jgi:NitT/TauT family transport system ATP-binding protein
MGHTTESSHPANAARAATEDGVGSAIEARDLGKTYKTRRGTVEAVRGASFDVRCGEFVALVGPSGCGKSTILHIVAGLIEKTRGTVQVSGSEARAGRADVGIMLQRPVLLPWRTILANVILPTEIFGIDVKTSEQRARDLLALVGLAGFEDRHPWELSGGMQQRVSLARLLVFEPKILLMDEPFAALDELTRVRLNGELAALHERLGRSTLYVTHNIQEAVFLADRVVLMKPHPGEIFDVVEISLPRPRSFEILDSARTAGLVAQIRKMLSAAEELESGDVG